MHVTYTPKDTQRDGDPAEWDIDLGDVPSDQCELIERHFGGTWLMFEDAVRKGDTLARRLLLWHLKRTDHPGAHVNLKDLPTFTRRELTVDHSSDELREMRAIGLRNNNFDTDREREQWLRAVDAEIGEALEREGRMVPAETTIDGELVPDPLQEAAAAAARSSSRHAAGSPAITSSSPSARSGSGTGSPSPATESTTSISAG